MNEWNGVYREESGQIGVCIRKNIKNPYKEIQRKCVSVKGTITLSKDHKEKV